MLVGESKAALPAVLDSGLQATSAADAKESANTAINPFHFGVGNRRPPGCRGREISSESVVARLLLVIRTVVVGAFAYDVEVLVETDLEHVAIAESDLFAMGCAAVPSVGLDDRAAAREVERDGGGLVKSGTVRGGSSSALEAIAIACAGPHDDESERSAGDPSRL